MLKKHAIMTSLIVLEFILIKYAIPNLIVIPYYIYPAVESAELLVIFFLDGILVEFIFTSLVMVILYYPLILFTYSLFQQQSLSFFFLLDLLTFSSTYFISALFIGFIGWFIRRNMSDTWFEQLSLFGYKFKPKIALIGFTLVIALYFFLFYGNLPLIAGSMLNVIGISLFGDYYDLPLILLSWFATPYSLTPRGEISKQGICLGNIVGILSKSGIIDSSVIRVNSSRKYKWSGIKANYCIDFSKTKNYNIIVVGTSGSGKSNFAKLLASKLSVNFLVFDLHGEYYLNEVKRVDVSQISVNPLSLFNRNPKERALEIAYMLKSLFNLGNIQAIELTNLIVEAYAEKGLDPDDPSTWSQNPPTFRDVLLLLERHKKNALSAQEINKYQSLEPYLQYLSSTVFQSNSINFEELLNSSYILDFSSVPTNEVKYIIMETILKSIQSLMYSRKSSKIENLVIIDEAPFLLSKESGKQLIERLLAEGRKFGFGFLLISQSVDYLKEVIPNAGLFYAFNIVEPGELEYISKFFGGSDLDMYYTLYETFPKLPRGVFVTRDLLGRFIYLVQFYEGDVHV
ncbi:MULTISPECIES: ATP-binding protein [unclassified Stygiolobus]|uniref:ATP-binding protein n=2 Tax=Stygiolobus TaxID=41674 RepID=UPI00307E5B22